MIAKWFLSALLTVFVLLAVPHRSEAAEMNQADAQARPVADAAVMYPGGKWSPRPVRFGVDRIENVPVTMDDGVVLDANIAYPTDLASGRRAKGPFPVVVEHMPYVQFAVPVKANAFFAEHGYISVQVRARGLGKSGGEVQFLSPREGLDGKAIIDWAAHKLEGSDGRVGLIGCSWPGAIAMTDVAAVGPGSPLKAAVAACSGMENMNRQSWLNAGMPTMSFWQFVERGAPLTGNSAAGQRFFKRFGESILSGGDMAFDADYWRERGRATLAQRIVDNGVPMLLWAGWGDVLETGTLRAYVALQNAHAKRPLEAPMEPGQPVTPRYQMIMGGWDHGQGLDMGVFLQWMETWVKGVDTGIAHTRTPMHVFEPGSNRWLNLSGYPVIEQSTRWHLSTQGRLQADSTDAPATSDALYYGEPSTPGARLSYTSEPLTQGATIAGPMSATLHASSSNTNLVFIGQLFDVAPDGSAVLISRGALLGSQHKLDEAKSWRDAAGTVTWPWPRLTRDEYLTPNQRYRFDLPLAPRQWGVQPGHRIRLEITTQTAMDRCPATGLPSLNDSDPCRLTQPQEKTVPGGVYRIELGGATPSTLNLPLLPYQHFPAVPAAMLSYPWNEGQRSVGGPHAKPFALPLDWGAASSDATNHASVARTAYPGGRWQPPPVRYAAATQDTTIALADGTKLAATVAYPVDRQDGARAAGPFPVIVEFTPYLGFATPVSAIPYFVERGYIYAVVRPRGTGGSTGQLQQFTSQDGRDGAAVVNWAAALEGSNRRVALAGCSYPGATGLATAAAVRSGSPLKAVVAACIGLDMQHRQVWTSNGLPNAALSAYAPRAGAMMGEQPSVTGYFDSFLKGVMAGGPEAYDGYWQDRLPLSRAADIVANGIPVLLWTGWSDINEIGGIHAYLALQNAAAGRSVNASMDTAKTDPRWQIIVGDWAHAQGLDMGVYLQWFETWLKGEDTGMAHTRTPMHVYEKGTGRWVNLAGYPVARTATRLSFGPGGALIQAKAAGKGSARLVWGNPETRDGSVAFTSEPFAQGATIAGPISATVYASSSNTNFQLIANLYDVAPNGDAQRISIGALLGSQSRIDPARSWRDDAGTLTWPWPVLLRDEYLQPGRMQRFDLFLALRQWGLAPGHRVRLVLSTQSPASVCPAEGEPTFVSEPCRLTAPQQATLPGGVYRIGFGKDQPSSLNLPLLPYQVFESVESGPTPTGWDETNRRMAPAATTTLPLDWGR